MIVMELAVRVNGQIVQRIGGEVMKRIWIFTRVNLIVSEDEQGWPSKWTAAQRWEKG